MNTHRMHANSLRAFNETSELRTGRTLEVYTVIQIRGPLIDREAMALLGHTDPNKVRPRITELIDAGWLVECGPARDPVTGKTVRRCRALSAEERNARRAGTTYSEIQQELCLA